MLYVVDWLSTVRRILPFGLVLGLLVGAPQVAAQGVEPPGAVRPGAIRSTNVTSPAVAQDDWTCGGAAYCVILPVLSRRVAPYAPTLDSITAPDNLGNYTLSWSYDSADVPATSYTLEGAPRGDFAPPTSVYYPASMNSWQVRSITPGTYYYRVRGSNEWGAGQWSNTQSVRVYSLFDEFNDPGTGWTVRRTSSPDRNLATAIYHDSVLQTGLNDKFDFAIFSPMFEAPPVPYRLQVRTRIIHLGNELSCGMVFGAPNSSVCPIDRIGAGNPDGCFRHYYRLNVVFGGYYKFQVKSIDYHDAEKGSGVGNELVPWQNVDNLTDHEGWNAWEVRVYEDGFAIFVNGVLAGWTDNTTYIHDPYYGIFLSTFEYNGATFEHDYFIAEPLPSSAHLPTGGERLAGTDWYVPVTGLPAED